MWFILCAALHLQLSISIKSHGIHLNCKAAHCYWCCKKAQFCPSLLTRCLFTLCAFKEAMWKCTLTHERLSHPWLTKLKPSSQAPGSTDGNQEVSFPIDMYGNLPPGYRPAPNQACRIFKEPVILAESLYCDWRVSLSEIDDPAHGLDLPHQTPLLF